VLQALLDEGVPIRDLVRIFEALSLRAKASTELDGLVEAARGALGPAIASRYAGGGALPVITLDPRLEQSLLEALRPGDGGAFLAIDADRAETVVADTNRLAEAAEQRGVSPVLACTPQLRAPLYRLLRAGNQAVPVLSYTEIAGSPAPIQTMGVVGHAYASIA
jgi:flagellar biosynthesis protein FlhA